MGEGTSGGGIANHKFFYTMLHNIADSYPIVFSSNGSHRPYAQRYREFSGKWGAIKTLYEICDEKIEKIGEIYQFYLNDYLQYLSFRLEKAQVDEEEDKFQDQLRAAKRKNR